MGRINSKGTKRFNRVTCFCINGIRYDIALFIWQINQLFQSIDTRIKENFLQEAHGLIWQNVR
jgi:hypothetical protein